MRISSDGTRLEFHHTILYVLLSHKGSIFRDNAVNVLVFQVCKVGELVLFLEEKREVIDWSKLQEDASYSTNVKDSIRELSKQFILSKYFLIYSDDLKRLISDQLMVLSLLNALQSWDFDVPSNYPIVWRGHFIPDCQGSDVFIGEGW